MVGQEEGKETFVIPSLVHGEVKFRIGHDIKQAPTAETDGTVGRSGATCIGCESAVELKYIRAEGKAGRLGAKLMATVAEGNRTRIYQNPHRA